MKAELTPQKLRGGYYTPRPIADFLARWAVQRATDSVLEPSCGDGALIEAVLRRREGLGAGTVTGTTLGLELNPDEARTAANLMTKARYSGSIVVGDFFTYCRDTLLSDGLWEAIAPRFDAVVGNPPFIRYQHFPEGNREIAFQLMKRIGLHPNKLTNAWVAFLVCGAMTLKEDGRMAMVIPAELLQVSYAAEVRRFLTEFFERITLITFRNLVFPGIQQEVILLLAERTAGESHGIRTVELGSAADLAHFDFFESLNADLKPLDHGTEKWTKYFLPSREILLLRRLRTHDSVFSIRDIAEVDVGVVTGENEFFILRPSDARDLGLAKWSKRTISRSVQLAGLTLSSNDWRELRNQDSKILLFAPEQKPLEELPEAARTYIEAGEAKGHDTGYKCRIRKLWYNVPSMWIPDAFALRQVHRFPKLVVNDARATTTDTVHRVRFKSGVDGTQVAAAFLNSMTFAFAEVMGRSYGGGVLTFEPTEVEGLPIPLLGAEQLDQVFIDESLRRGDITAVLDHTDEILLRRHLGLSREEIAVLRGAWCRLRDRRINRRSSTQLPLLAVANQEIPTPSAAMYEPFEIVAV